MWLISETLDGVSANIYRSNKLSLYLITYVHGEMFAIKLYFVYV